LKIDQSTPGGKAGGLMDHGHPFIQNLPTRLLTN
jgi:hypothetical protein